MRTLTEEEIKEITGYILYDLHELGYLKQEASNELIFSKTIPDKLLKEIESSINGVITDNLENK